MLTGTFWYYHDQQNQIALVNNNKVDLNSKLWNVNLILLSKHEDKQCFMQPQWKNAVLRRLYGCILAYNLNNATVLCLFPKHMVNMKLYSMHFETS